MKFRRWLFISLRRQIFWTTMSVILMSVTMGLTFAFSLSYFSVREGDWAANIAFSQVLVDIVYSDPNRQLIDPDHWKIKLTKRSNPKLWYVYVRENEFISSYNAPDWATEDVKAERVPGDTAREFYSPDDKTEPVYGWRGDDRGAYIKFLIGGVEDRRYFFPIIALDILPSLILQLFLLALPFAFLMSILIIRRLNKSVIRLKTELSAVDFDQKFSPITDKSTPKELVPLLDSFNGTIAVAQEAYSQQRQFATELTHELRTPIAAVMAQIQLLDPSKPNQAMLERLTQLHGFISQLLDSNRLRWGDEIRASTDIVPLVRDVAAQLTPLVIASKREISFSSDQISIEAVTDATAISHVVHNLIANAILHGAGLISITVSNSARPDHVTINIADQGTSLKDKDIAVLSHEFQKGTGNGSGLGLSIAHNIMQKLGGDLTGRTTEQKTEFILVLPS